MNDEKPSLAAAVFTVAPSKPVTTPNFLGRAVQHFWLRSVGQRNSDLESKLHDQPDFRPFTCSDLVGGEQLKPNSKGFAPNKPAWLRITALTPKIVALLSDLVANPPAQIELDGTAFHVREATLDPAKHNWASTAKYEALAAPYLLQRQTVPYHLTFQFASPTTFRMRRDKDEKTRTWPVPMPDWVFGYLHRRWNAFSSIKLPDELKPITEESIVLSRYELFTQVVPLRRGVPQMGCVGRARYVLIDKDEYWASILHLLAAFAFYAGVGYQTTTGLGQARLLTKNR